MAGTKQEHTILLRARDEATKVFKSLGSQGLRSVAALGRKIREGAKDLISLRKNAKRAFTALRTGALLAGRALKTVLVPGIGQLVLALSGLAIFVTITRSAAEFGKTMAEVSTIVDTTVVDIDALSAAVLDLSAAQGSRELETAKALYQSISAGVGDASEAMVFLEKANRLAVGGVAELSSTVDVLSSILASYNLKVGQTERLSDILFTTVKNGKTTISELSTSLGQVTPIAAQFGVTFEELTAAIGTITLSGVQTAEAATQVRAALVALGKKAGEVDELFRNRLGKSFDDQTIATRGLVPVLQDLRNALGGSDTALLAFLGRVEAANATLNLTGRNVEKFTRLLRENEKSAGAAGEAFEKQIASPAFRVAQTINALRIEFLRVGQAILLAATEAIELGGGLDGIREKGRIVASVLAELASAGVRGFGVWLQAVDDVIAAMGGVENVTKVAIQASKVFTAAILTGLQLIRREVNRLVQILITLPAALRSLKADLPGVLGGTETRAELKKQLDAIEADIGKFVDRRAQLFREAGQDAAFLRDEDLFFGTGLTGRQKLVLQTLNQDLERASQERRGILARFADAPLSEEEAFGRLRAAAEVGSQNVTGALGLVSAEYEKLLDLLNKEIGPGLDSSITGALAKLGAKGLAKIPALLALEAGAVQDLVAQANEALLGLSVEVPVELNAADIEANLAKSLEFGRLEATFLEQAARTDKERLAVVRQTADLREQELRTRARESGFDTEQLARLLELQAAQEKILQGQALSFESFGAELERLQGRLLPTVESQTRAINDWSKAEIERIKLLQIDLGLTAEQVKQLTLLVEKIRQQGVVATETTERLITWEAVFDTLGTSIRTNLVDQLASVATQAGDTSEAWRQMATQILGDLARITAQKGLQAALGGTRVGTFLGVGDPSVAAPGETATAAAQGEAQAIRISAALTEGSAALNTASGAVSASGIKVAAGGEGMVVGAAATDKAAIALIGAASTWDITAGLIIKAAAALAASAKAVAAAQIVSTAAGGGGSPDLAAMGGVWRGGFKPIASAAHQAGLKFGAFASGSPGISQPTLGMVGEGKFTEAVIPLPDGRHVDARIKGGAGHTTIYEGDRWFVDAIDVQSFDRALRKSGGTVRALNNESLAQSRESRRRVRRVARGRG